MIMSDRSGKTAKLISGPPQLEHGAHRSSQITAQCIRLWHVLVRADRVSNQMYPICVQILNRDPQGTGCARRGDIRNPPSGSRLD